MLHFVSKLLDYLQPYTQILLSFRSLPCCILELSDIGRNEAKAAGQLLKAHDVKFDVMYTSWLMRAIETGWTILDELDQLWLPIIKSWRLNERMYGALTSISKQMVKEKFGYDQFIGEYHALIFNFI